MNIRVSISLMTALIALSSGKCEKGSAETGSMEGYIFEGKSFLSTVYFDPSRENTVVEIQTAKIGFLDTLYTEVNAADSSTILKGKKSSLTYISKNKALYENKEHGLRITLKKERKTEKIANHRSKVYRYMANGLIGSLKVKDNFPEYKFDWDTQSDAIYFQEGKFQENYAPNFLKKYQEALQNRN